MTIYSLGNNVDQLLEQLAPRVGPGDDGDDVPDNDIVGRTKVNEIIEYLEALRKDTLHSIDLWRIKLGPDPSTKIKPLRNAVPYRTESRQYSPVKVKFLVDDCKRLEEFNLVFGNNQSRWACAAVPSIAARMINAQPINARFQFLARRPT
ncbi:hypothetical protein CCR75_003511 [Bremia lactucae]|uniref:Uncharacterized protein n=1 Tax=Bremia lactucae TaxID=4779 RepID=A0A976IGN6_BRELC|nr:hypothetical protein CCR75_003511 [Bremia lactucae]